ncbi:MAG: cytochrome c nitrite reductase small subunit [Bacteroidales bacterium]
MKVISPLKRFFRFFFPPGRWRFPVIIILSIFTGLIAFLLKISNAPSYISDKPETCVNCHIMAPQYATWHHSSHREVAVCNDCHVPQNNFANKYYFKAKDGLRHATIFTLRAEPQVIFIKEAGRNVVQNNCVRCHDPLLKGLSHKMPTDHFYQSITDKLCWDCHSEVPHGRVNSLSSVPGARVPLPVSPVPEWIKKLTNTDENETTQ